MYLLLIIDANNFFTQESCPYMVRWLCSKKHVKKANMIVAISIILLDITVICFFAFWLFEPSGCFFHLFLVQT